ncbi:MAG: hypothetical protein M1820_006613 [Bogoriella megaspora]|nr:MAG: hypothetical protein M1820_006613 [Bogoriella megaspora]
MLDPCSVLGTATGVISLALGVYQALFEVAKHMHGASQEIRDLAEKLKEVTEMISVVHGVLDTNRHLFKPEFFWDASSVFQRFRSLNENIEKLILHGAPKRASLKALRWALHGRKKAKDFTTEMESFKLSVNISLQTAVLAIAAKGENKISDDHSNQDERIATQNTILGSAIDSSRQYIQKRQDLGGREIEGKQKNPRSRNSNEWRSMNQEDRIQNAFLGSEDAATWLYRLVFLPSSRSSDSTAKSVNKTNSDLRMTRLEQSPNRNADTDNKSYREATTSSRPYSRRTYLDNANGNSGLDDSGVVQDLVNHEDDLNSATISSAIYEKQAISAASTMPPTAPFHYSATQLVINSILLRWTYLERYQIEAITSSAQSRPQNGGKIKIVSSVGTVPSSEITIEKLEQDFYVSARSSLDGGPISRAESQLSTALSDPQSRVWTMPSNTATSSNRGISSDYRDRFREFYSNYTDTSARSHGLETVNGSVRSNSQMSAAVSRSSQRQTNPQGYHDPILENPGGTELIFPSIHGDVLVKHVDRLTVDALRTLVASLYHDVEGVKKGTEELENRQL